MKAYSLINFFPQRRFTITDIINIQQNNYYVYIHEYYLYNINNKLIKYYKLIYYNEQYYLYNKLIKSIDNIQYIYRILLMLPIKLKCRKVYISYVCNELIISLLNEKYLIDYYIAAKCYMNNSIINNAYQYKYILNNIINAKKFLYDLNIN